MKIIAVKIATALALACLLAGCTTPSGDPDYTGSGALIGGLSGATIGAMADRGAPGAGALIGGVAGLITGGLIGHSMDQQSYPPPPRTYTYTYTYYPPPAPPAPQPPPPPSVADIKAMTRAGTSDDIIIAQIKNTRAVYNLNADALIDLNKAGVSQRVIVCMVNTANPGAP